MNEMEQAKKEMKDGMKELLTPIKLVQVVMEAEFPGGGDLFIEVMMDELAKLRKKPECHCCDEQKPDVHTGVTQYIGTKLVQARRAWRLTGRDGHKHISPYEYYEEEMRILEGEILEDGYEVFYPDGYQSWSPKEVFEDAYRETTGMNFGLAIEAAKMGKKIARKGWNGKDQYVEIGKRFVYATHDGCGVEAQHEDIGSAALVFVGTRGRQVAWLASQSDMLADDWYIVG